MKSAARTVTDQTTNAWLDSQYNAMSVVEDLEMPTAITAIKHQIKKEKQFVNASLSVRRVDSLSAC